jgi:hypothetical protein
VVGFFVLEHRMSAVEWPHVRTVTQEIACNCRIGASYPAMDAVLHRMDADFPDDVYAQPEQVMAPIVINPTPAYNHGYNAGFDAGYARAIADVKAKIDAVSRDAGTTL